MAQNIETCLVYTVQDFEICIYKFTLVICTLAQWIYCSFGRISLALISTSKYKYKILNGAVKRGIQCRKRELQTVAVQNTHLAVLYIYPPSTVLTAQCTVHIYPPCTTTPLPHNQAKYCHSQNCSSFILDIFSFNGFRESHQMRRLASGRKSEQ